ncbi:hypothetical protein COCC4DRAFT_162180 [Bipolaris maydis ATCC 48331]|uniref:Zn(2)-C6 fungal-type domain-containing protein n=2 Tax=Cochliobolus heterostrophus TaxID=5016 RepID=M2TI06_COCH5|nr:uncharacterized protein COCC4DRAFT_162180 [Bipolaris maydis ATCC 48331]EMD86139.1 hypothetical protein COCHEDRAFT_1207188 [Bipolaris maydis C5]KAJ5022123.1 hypothetical protein J3E73DRAFT_218849 [Bipolaris maydis]EMD92275.1 hypothetical protein COCHEDRAFT_1134597 [Bipolaris maydis C5]ENI07967.1 hypothetical protein COCC4DRAFT_162180 [Bipolaris maydis ATCC 48331]KAJ5060809.1 putative C6 transcription factor [Bipolaris maydis]
MSSDSPTPEPGAVAPPPPPPLPAPAAKPQRVLSCILCAQRKVKCDRRSPCSNCIKAGVQCVSAATIPRQRRRRFPERELLERLRHYERLLTEHNIPFEPLHASHANRYSSPHAIGSNHVAGTQAKDTTQNSSAELPRPSLATESTQAKSFWSAMVPKLQYPNDGESQESDDDSDETDPADPILEPQKIVKAWDDLSADGLYRNEHLLFCSRTVGVELSALHPSQTQIFKLWQLYLENVDPLLKLTHTPTLQARIIDAAGDVTNIEPNLEALMFAIYCMVISSLDPDQCQTMFGVPKLEVIRGYQLGAREALLNCGFLKSSNRECLTALHLYLFTIKPEVDPRSLSSLLGTAIRIAQRMGIDTEATNARHSVLEAELRRRLWWSLVLFDSRIAEMTDFKLATLIPTWDCRIPHNINDFSLRNEMKTPPTESSNISEALFAVVRCKLGDFIRHNPSHLDFINPIMKKLVKKSPSGSCSELEDIASFESVLESKYLLQCDPQIPLHFMTIWWTRVFFAKTRFAHYLATRSPNPENESDEKYGASLVHARTMLECDTMLMGSPLTKAFRWIIYLHFPFPAYVHLIQDLKRRPLSNHADLAWQAMSDNCSARFVGLHNEDNPMESRRRNRFFAIFCDLVLQAWDVRKAASMHSEPPLLVKYITQRLSRMSGGEMDSCATVEVGGIPYASELMDLGSIGPCYDLTETFSMAPAQISTSFNDMQWVWPAPNWGAVPEQNW